MYRQWLNQNAAGADRSYVATYDLSGDGNSGSGDELVLTQTFADQAWQENNDRVSLSLRNPRYLEIAANAYYETTNNVLYQRIAPMLQLMRTRGGVDSVINWSATGYQRHLPNHSRSSNNFTKLITDHRLGDVYWLRAQQGSGINSPLPIILGDASFKAVFETPVGN